MKQHFIVCAVTKPHESECLATVGTVCEEKDLNEWMRTHGVLRYKIKSIDRKPVPDWDKTDWVAV